MAILTFVIRQLLINLVSTSSVLNMVQRTKSENITSVQFFQGDDVGNATVCPGSTYAGTFFIQWKPRIIRPEGKYAVKAYISIPFDLNTYNECITAWMEGIEGPIYKHCQPTTCETFRDHYGFLFPELRCTTKELISEYTLVMDPGFAMIPGDFKLTYQMLDSNNKEFFCVLAYWSVGE